MSARTKPTARRVQVAAGDDAAVEMLRAAAEIHALTM